MTTIAEELQIIRLTAGRDILLPTPAECEVLLARARNEGIVVSRLYVLSVPLTPFKGGSFLLGDRSMWIHYDLARPGGLDQALRYELHELAHAKEPPGDYASIDEDWDEEARTWQRAAGLAAQWGWERLFPAGYLEERLAELEVLREHHWAAAYLVGTLSPAIARAAYDALCDLRLKEGWDLTLFGEALGGWSEDSQANGRVLDFDRCQLRSWRGPYQRGGSFDEMALRYTERTDRALRSALRMHADHPVCLEQLVWQKSRHRGTELCFIQVEDEQDLYQAIGTLNALLLDESAESALATWHCYGQPARDKAPPLYRLAVRYGERRDPAELGNASAGEERLHPVGKADREAWVLFPSPRPRGLTYEAALQRYIASWLTWQSLRHERASDGLTLLWGWLK